MVAELIEYLKDRKYHIKSVEIAREVVKLMDEISGREYAEKIKSMRKDYNDFSGKV